jgi:hypothetical protein
MRQKYIVFKDGSIEDIITFSELMNHNRAALALDPESIISAGFLEVYAGDDGELGVACFGESTTLHLKSRGDEDARIAMLRLYRRPY